MVVGCLRFLIGLLFCVYVLGLVDAFVYFVYGGFPVSCWCWCFAVFVLGFFVVVCCVFCGWWFWFSCCFVFLLFLVVCGLVFVWNDCCLQLYFVCCLCLVCDWLGQRVITLCACLVMFSDLLFYDLPFWCLDCLGWWCFVICSYFLLPCLFASCLRFWLLWFGLLLVLFICACFAVFGCWRV